MLLALHKKIHLKRHACHIWHSSTYKITVTIVGNFTMMADHCGVWISQSCLQSRLRSWRKIKMHHMCTLITVENKAVATCGMLVTQPHHVTSELQANLHTIPKSTSFCNRYYDTSRPNSLFCSQHKRHPTVTNLNCVGDTLHQWILWKKLWVCPHRHRQNCAHFWTQREIWLDCHWRCPTRLSASGNRTGPLA